ncbi:MAG: hypothetical protein AAF334_08120, partial [Pseudomonadota bacterium]
FLAKIYQFQGVIGASTMALCDRLRTNAVPNGRDRKFQLPQRDGQLARTPLNKNARPHSKNQ